MQKTVILWDANYDREKAMTTRELHVHIALNNAIFPQILYIVHFLPAKLFFPQVYFKVPITPKSFFV